MRGALKLREDLFTMLTLVAGLALAAAPAVLAQVGNNGESLDPSTLGLHDLSGPAGATSMLYAPSEEDDPGFRAAVAALLGGTVDYFDARAATPDAGTLAGYDCVFTWANFSYENNVLFGDRLADFVDAGGNVVLGAFATYTSGNYLDGRIMDAGYCPVVGGTNHFVSSNYAGDGTTQIHNGVTNYECTYRDILSLMGGGLQDGSYLDGEIAHAYRSDFKVIYSNGAGVTQLGCIGDWALLVANSCQASDTVPTLPHAALALLALALALVAAIAVRRFA